MKRFFLTFCFCLLSLNAWASKDAEFIRVECNQDLGVVTISNHQIQGRIITNYFGKMRPFYKYESSLKENSDSQAEVLLISNFTWADNKPFVYQCKMGEQQFYDIKITHNDMDCGGTGNSYKIDVAEGMYDEQNVFQKKQDILKQISFGCDGLTLIQFTLDDHDGNMRLELTRGMNSTFFYSDELDGGLTDEMIEDEKREEREFEVELKMSGHHKE